jgi:prefoldin alpha subunit
MATRAAPSAAQLAELERILAAELGDKQAALDTLLQYRADYSALLETLRPLPLRTRHAVMVPVTARAFMPGHLKHTNEVLVLLGDDLFAERSVAQACEMIARRQARIADKIAPLEAEVLRLRNIERMQRLLAAHDGGGGDIVGGKGDDGVHSGARRVAADDGEMIEIREDLDEEAEGGQRSASAKGTVRRIDPDAVARAAVESISAVTGASAPRAAAQHATRARDANQAAAVASPPHAPAASRKSDEAAAAAANIEDMDFSSFLSHLQEFDEEQSEKEKHGLSGSFAAPILASKSSSSSSSSSAPPPAAPGPAHIKFGPNEIFTIPSRKQEQQLAFAASIAGQRNAPAPASSAATAAQPPPSSVPVSILKTPKEAPAPVSRFKQERATAAAAFNGAAPAPDIAAPSAARASGVGGPTKPAPLPVSASSNAFSGRIRERDGSSAASASSSAVSSVAVPSASSAAAAPAADEQPRRISRFKQERMGVSPDNM